MIIPCLRYRDANAAIDWLCDTFGFTKQLVVPGPDETVRHAQLRLGRGMVMVGTLREDEIVMPDTVGGKETQVPLIVMKDVEGACARAQRNGASILVDYQDQPPLGKFFSCADPEGHIWNVGDYDPFA